MNPFQEAIAREDWELAAHYLILGMLRMLDSLPPGAAEAMIELIEAEGPATEHPHRRRQRRRRVRGSR